MKSFELHGYQGGHVQGMCADLKNGVFYFSFTTCLVKTDLNGNVLGTVEGLVGHLGCIALSPVDGMIYGSLEYKNDTIGRNIRIRTNSNFSADDGFYVVRFHGEKICRIGHNAELEDIMEAVHLQEVLADYQAPQHRFGCSGIDGVTFAPEFGSNDNKMYLYVAYGIYSDVKRKDNDHQIILQYDISDWNRYAEKLSQDKKHKNGPNSPRNKYFLFTGNTRYGIQNLEYDQENERILAAVYKGEKEEYPNYSLYYVDCKKKACYTDLKGLDQKGFSLSLAQCSEYDEKSGTTGSYFSKGSTGICSVRNHTFIISSSIRTEEGYGCRLEFYRETECGVFEPLQL